MKFADTKKGTIKNFFTPLFCWGIWIRDPGWVKNQDPGSRINIPDPQHWNWWWNSDFLKKNKFTLFFPIPYVGNLTIQGQPARTGSRSRYLLHVNLFNIKRSAVWGPRQKFIRILNLHLALMDSKNKNRPFYKSREIIPLLSIWDRMECKRSALDFWRLSVFNSAFDFHNQSGNCANVYEPLCPHTSAGFCSRKFCGSGMFIPDPGFWIFCPSLIIGPGSRDPTTTKRGREKNKLVVLPF